MYDYRNNNKWTVYVHIIPKSISKHNHDKYYVGITGCSISQRWGKNGSNYKGLYFFNAIKKYGWNNIEHEIIAKNLTKNEACEFEKTLIKVLKSNNKKYGYNISEGGDGGNRKDIISVKQYDLFGNFIKKYPSAADAAKHNNINRTNITHACKNHGKAAGYMWCYANEEINYPYKRKGQKTVIQKTLNGEYISSYISLKEASEKTGINKGNIYRCITGKNKYAGGYLWFYES